MRINEPTVATLNDSVSTRETTSVQLATIVSLAADGTPELRIGSAGPVVPARLAIRVTRDRLETATVLQQQAVVVFEGNDPSKPIVIGLLEVMDADHEAVQPRDEPQFIEADVDGRRVRITAQDEVVLQCGSASVTLRRNGRVIIRGTYVETHSEGTNRIKGGQVQIN
jgi:Domain of unknown function (DUF6484)